MSASELLIINSQFYARVILLYCSGRNHFYLTFEQQCRGLQRAVLFFYYTNCISHYKRSEWNCYHPNSSNCCCRLFFFFALSLSLFLLCIKKLSPVCRSVYLRQRFFLNFFLSDGMGEVFWRVYGRSRATFLFKQKKYRESLEYQLEKNIQQTSLKSKTLPADTAGWYGAQKCSMPSFRMIGSFLRDKLNAHRYFAGSAVQLT